MRLPRDCACPKPNFSNQTLNFPGPDLAMRGTCCVVIQRCHYLPTDAKRQQASKRAGVWGWPFLRVLLPTGPLSCLRRKPGFRVASRKHAPREVVGSRTPPPGPPRHHRPSQTQRCCGGRDTREVAQVGMNLQEFSTRCFHPSRPRGMNLQEFSMWAGSGGDCTCDRPPASYGAGGNRHEHPPPKVSSPFINNRRSRIGPCVVRKWPVVGPPWQLAPLLSGVGIAG